MHNVFTGYVYRDIVNVLIIQQDIGVKYQIKLKIK
jgi:hypothetical protein